LVFTGGFLIDPKAAILCATKTRASASYQNLSHCARGDVEQSDANMFVYSTLVDDTGTVFIVEIL